MATVLSGGWMSQPWKRRAVFAVLCLVVGIFCIWPRHYLAEADLLPQDSSGGLSAALAQGTGSALINLGSLIGNKQPVEADLTIARSEAVIDDVVARMHLLGKPGYRTRPEAARRLRRRIAVESIRGSILEITATDRDPEFARALAAAAADAIQFRLTTLNFAQTAQRKMVAENRMADATKRLADSQAAIRLFRTQHHLAEPLQQLGAAVGLLASDEAQVQAKEVEIATLRQFTTPDNIKLQSALAELASLQKQLASAQSAGSVNISNPEWLATENGEYANLYRDERESEILYEVYRKYLEQVTIDSLTSNQNMFLMQPAYVSPDRQYNIPAIALLSLIFMTGLIIEFYKLTPPVGYKGQ